MIEKDLAVLVDYTQQRTLEVILLLELYIYVSNVVERRGAGGGFLLLPPDAGLSQIFGIQGLQV